MFFFCWIQWCGTKSHLSSCQANIIKMKKNHLVKPPERFPDGNFFTCMASFKWVQKIQSTIQSNVYVHLHFPTLLNLGGIWGTSRHYEPKKRNIGKCLRPKWVKKIVPFSKKVFLWHVWNLFPGQSVHLVNQNKIISTVLSHDKSTTFFDRTLMALWTS